IIPVRMGKIKVYLHAVAVGGVGDFLDDVAVKRRVHDAVGEIAVLDFRLRAVGPVDAAGHAGMGVKHGKSVMVLGGEGDHLDAVGLEQVHPGVGIEIGGIKGLVKLLIGLASFVVQARMAVVLPDEWPGGVFAVAQLHIDAPMNAHAEFHLPEGGAGRVGSLAVIRIGRVFDVRFDLFVVVVGDGHFDVVAKDAGRVGVGGEPEGRTADDLVAGDGGAPV